MEKKRRSGGQAASFASTTKEHLKIMNLPTAEGGWLPMASNARAWSKLILNKPHETPARLGARAASSKQPAN